jgi:DGQHR domain-containing protein
MTKPSTAGKKTSTPTAQKREKPKKGLKFDGLKFRQRVTSGPSFVLFHASAMDIDSFADIDPLGPDGSGAQREKNSTRVAAIKTFLSGNPENTIPPAIVIAFAHGKTSFELNKLTVKTTAKSKAGVIVDGQHRLLGALANDKSMEFAVIGLLDCDNVETAFQFLVINNKSSKVVPKHSKALLNRLKGTALIERLKTARLSFDATGIRDVDIVNSSDDSPFMGLIDWTTTTESNRIVQPTAIELTLSYMDGLGIAEFSDRDNLRNTFLEIWKTIKAQWTDLWDKESRLISKVGIYCLTRVVVDMMISWADNDEISINLGDLSHIKAQTTKILGHMDPKFWTAKWAENSKGGFDTTQGRDRVIAALTQLYRNGKNDRKWYTDIQIIDPNISLI